MNDILSAILGSMHTDLARVDRVSMNLANLQTPGYKSEVVSAMPFASRLAAATLSSDAAARGPVRVHTDQRPGTLKSTGHNLDIALTGDGWLEVATDRGIAYTRQGNLRLDARGRLVTQQGYPVLGASGEIQLVHGAPVIDGAGRVFEGASSGIGVDRLSSTPVATLKLVQFAPVTTLTRVGDGLVTTTADAFAAPEGTVQVHQGFLENSNVSHMQEMVRLMESVRHMESMQKVAHAYDEMLGNSIRKLGDPS